MKYIFTVLLGLAFIRAYTQTKNSEPFEKSSIFKLPLITILKPEYASIDLAYEFQFHRYFSQQVNVGVLVPLKPAQTKGVEIKTEFRFYPLSQKKYNSGLYAAPQLYYRYADYNTKYIGYSIDNNLYPTETLQVKRNAYSALINLGCQTKAKKIVFDIYAGVGIQFNYSKYITPENVYVGQSQTMGFIFTGDHHKYQEYYDRLIFNLGFSLGYRIFKKA